MQGLNLVFEHGPDGVGLDGLDRVRLDGLDRVGLEALCNSGALVNARLKPCLGTRSR